MTNEIDEPIGNFVVAKLVEFNLTLSSNNEEFSEGNGPVEVARILYYAEKRELCQQSVTLDGKPAMVTGVQNRFAQVSQFPDGKSVEFAWETVRKVIAENHGAFQS
jgi:hypothetical protein